MHFCYLLNLNSTVVVLLFGFGVFFCTIILCLCMCCHGNMVSVIRTSGLILVNQMSNHDKSINKSALVCVCVCVHVCACVFVN